ncbi:MAG: GNAT family N-acetyltransferase [Bacteriovoracaceae bacterium]
MQLICGKLCDSLWTPELLKQLINFDQKFFDKPWTLNNWNETFKNGERYFLSVTIQDDQIVAFSLYYLIVEESMAHLLKILVNPDQRRFRLATKLSEKSEQLLTLLNIKKIVLDVAVGNNSAISFYLNENFEKIHMMNHFYGKGHHAWSMQKKI